MNQDFVFTSESATDGHPDKLCDRIADALVDRVLQQDPLARVVAECAVSSGIVFAASRQAGDANVDIAGLVREVIAAAGYTDGEFNRDTCTVMTSSGRIAEVEGTRVDEATLSDDEIEQVPARNMTNVFGFACDHTPDLLPLPVWLAHRLTRRLAAARADLPYLGPDAKAQVAVVFRRGRPWRLHAATLVASHRDGDPTPLSRLREDLRERVIAPALADLDLPAPADAQLLINPEGRVHGGPGQHSGMTGRKTAQDTYGEYARHGESALSGKDPGRIDRVGVYAARHAARNVVAAGLAHECEVLLAYAIGQTRPVSVQVDTRGTGRLADEEIRRRILRVFDFRPAAIVRDYRLRTLPSRTPGGFYRELACYGQLGRGELAAPWEAEDRVDALRD